MIRRDRVLLALLLNHGLRPDEVVCLTARPLHEHRGPAALPGASDQQETEVRRPVPDYRA